MLITNGKLITWEKENRILDGYALRIKNGKIVETRFAESPSRTLSRKKTVWMLMDSMSCRAIFVHTRIFTVHTPGVWRYPVRPPMLFLKFLKNYGLNSIRR